jgi:hypothetical protein
LRKESVSVDRLNPKYSVPEAHSPDYADSPRYFPLEYTACKLFKFMIINEPRGPFSLYVLMRVVAHCQRIGKRLARQNLKTLGARFAKQS